MGPEFYEEIGRKGGKATRDRHGVGFYEDIGKKGGEVVKEKYGADFYEEIGHKGGQKVKKLIAEAREKTRQNHSGRNYGVTAPSIVPIRRCRFLSRTGRVRFLEC